MQSGVTGINTVRVYNPVKQSYDQDPDGIFIRTWLPELSHLSPEHIHEPWKCPSPPANYPPPIVDLQTAARAAKERIYGKKSEKAVKDEAQTVYQKHGSRNPAREGARKLKRTSARQPTTKDKASNPQMSLEL